MGELEYLNEADYSDSSRTTITAYDCKSCGKHKKFRVLGVAFKTATVQCIGCNEDITVPRGLFYTG